MQKKWMVVFALCGVLLVGGILLATTFLRGRTSARTAQVLAWLRNPDSRPELKIARGSVCGDAPFAFPADGMVGFLWNDSFRPGHHHAGIDIFSGADAGTTPNYATYAGYLTREADWVSSVIVRAPKDPLDPSRQVWVYYTHMADRNGNSFISPEFPPGTKEVYIEAGTFLGYMGNYSGNPANPVGVHLHVSVVKDDGEGNYTNELDIRNTYDPSPYFGMRLNADENKDTIPVCER
ncbi:MAG: hypothetical protein LC099_03410 [Anaerolineales bacterium]|nr:hypothetical protein [Anaerolineales bacterium]